MKTEGQGFFRGKSAYTMSDLHYLWHTLFRKRKTLERLFQDLSVQRDKLQQMYDLELPRTTCQKGCRDCCTLDVSVFHYLEFINLLSHIVSGDLLPPPFDPDHRQCLFRDAEKGCTIYPQRPLICRFFGLPGMKALIGTCNKIQIDPRDRHQFMESIFRSQLLALHRMTPGRINAPATTMNEILGHLENPAYWLGYLIVKL